MADNTHIIAMAPQHGYCRDCKWWERASECVCWQSDGSKVELSAHTEYDMDVDMYTAPDFGCVGWEAK